jgi:hypothetical protein
MNIKTNNHYRPILYWHELTEKEQDEYRDAYDTIEESTFFRYRNWLYDLNDFLRVNSYCDSLYGRGEDHDMHGWDGYKNDSFFSSVLVAFSDDHEAVKVGMAFS